jgi:hypothetical protein
MVTRLRLASGRSDVRMVTRLRLATQYEFERQVFSVFASRRQPRNDDPSPIDFKFQLLILN